MIIQIRGTSGSGKSTCMKRFMDGYSDSWRGLYKEGRKKPLFYYLPNKNKTVKYDIIVLGHYESPCGGCDTIGSARQIFNLIKEIQLKYSPRIILCEGLLLSEDKKWTKELALTEEIIIFLLCTTIEDCLANIKKRRLNVGNLKEVKPDNTVNRYKVIQRAVEELSKIPDITTTVIDPNRIDYQLRSILSSYKPTKL